MESFDGALDPDGEPVRQEPPDVRARPASQMLEHHEFMDCMERAIAELPENQRAAILLCREGEISCEETKSSVVLFLLSSDIPSQGTLAHEALPRDRSMGVTMTSRMCEVE